MFMMPGARARTLGFSPNLTSARRGLFARGLQMVHPPQGRLTLQSGTPVMSTTQSGKTTLFYSPYVGNQIVLYDGVAFVPYYFSEISIGTSDATFNPAPIGASKVNDWFIWNSNNQLRLSHGIDWTNDTTRASGLTLQNGIYLNAAAIANGPEALRGTFVGTTRSNASSQIDWIFGATASGGTAGFFGVWNTFNRVSIGTDVTDSAASYLYTSATIRQANGSAGNQLSFVQGLQEDAIWASYNSAMQTGSALNASGQFGLGLDSTTTFNGQKFWVFNVAASADIAGGGVSQSMLPGIGLHVISANEKSNGVNACFFNNDSTATLSALLRL